MRASANAQAGPDPHDAKGGFDLALAEATAPERADLPPASLPAAAAPEHDDATGAIEAPEQLLALLDGSRTPPPATAVENAPAGFAWLGLGRAAATGPAQTVSSTAELPVAAAEPAAARDIALPAAPAVTAAPPTVPLSATAAATATAIALAAPRESTDPGAGGAAAEVAAPEPPPVSAAASAGPGGARAATAVPTAAIALPADPDAGFDDAFGARIAWLAGQRLGHAEIRVTPDHAGPIEVRLQLDGNRVSAEFHSANADVRQALEASMARLRDLLGQHGMQLAHADVGQGQGQSDRRGGAAGTDTAGTERDGEPAARAASGPIRHARGLLDEYA